jgi:hypothetical protein
MTIELYGVLKVVFPLAINTDIDYQTPRDGDTKKILYETVVAVIPNSSRSNTKL